MRGAPLVVAAVAAVLVAASGPARADADSLTDTLGPREVALGGASRAGAVGSLATTLNPAGLPLTHELVFEGAYGYRNQDGASDVAISACDSTTPAPGCLYYNYVASSPSPDGMESHRRAQVVGLTLSREIGPHLTFGSAIKYFDYNTDVMGEDGDASGFNWDVGITARLTETANVGLVGYNLWGAKSVQFPRAIGTGMQFRPIPALTGVFDALWNLDTTGPTGRYGGGLEYFVSGSGGQVGYPLRIGALHDVALKGTFLSGGLGVATMKFGLDVAARREVAGGKELAIIASMRFFGPRQVFGAPN